MSLHLLSIFHKSVLLYDVFLLTTPTYYCIQKSPSGSRNNNQECVVLGFFDTHDLWHFLSSFALFFSFLVSTDLYMEIYWNGYESNDVRNESNSIAYNGMSMDEYECMSPIGIWTIENVVLRMAQYWVLIM